MKILMKKDRTTEWVEVESAVYDAETDLQKLIAESPSIIPIEEIMGDTSPYVFSVRELGLPGSGNTDVLLFNADGNIGIIECKLASNPEIKRKVIGQILEYAAFLWNQGYDDLDSKVLQISGTSLAAGVSALTEQEQWNEESFKTSAQDILNRGAFNLIIAVDHINEELKRTIDYLNECGSTAFSFHALELHKYRSDKTEMLVPHMYGKVPQSKRRQSPERRLWNEQGFLDHVQENLEGYIVEFIKDLLEWTKAKSDRVFWGRGKVYGSFTFHYRRNDRTISVFTVTSLGYLYLNYGYLSDQVEETYLKKFHTALSDAPAFCDVQFNPKGFPSINLKELSQEGDESIDILKNAVFDLLP